MLHTPSGRLTGPRTRGKHHPSHQPRRPRTKLRPAPERTPADPLVNRGTQRAPKFRRSQSRLDAPS
jgi:hypothetical protein